MVEEEEENLGKKRRSKNKKVNEEGRRLCKFLEEYGWSIVNGNIKGDEEGEWTFTGGRGESVIDYVMGDEKTRERIEMMMVEGKVDSDHHPVTVWLGEGTKVRKKKKGGKARRKRGV